MIKLYPYLSYAGTLPFIFCATCLISGVNIIPILGDTEKVLSVYGLIIASFIAGAHWAQHLNVNDCIWSRSLAILSNTIAVLLWFGFLLLSFKILLGILAAVFIMLIIIDYRLFQMDIITLHYFQTRIFVTCIVITSFIISGISS
ncbi:DUF3429 domain-containing protein [Pseudemcibacter sp.]|uniref:DUF3429 domain-containing protein n=1 Tax=Pseudemcibacter sp. TaxID=2943293 RepID=UPI003F6A100B